MEGAAASSPGAAGFADYAGTAGRARAACMACGGRGGREVQLAEMPYCLGRLMHLAPSTAAFSHALNCRSRVN